MPFRINDGNISILYDKGLDEGFYGPTAQIKRRNGEQNELFFQFYAPTGNYEK